MTSPVPHIAPARSAPRRLRLKGVALAACAAPIACALVAAACGSSSSPPSNGSPGGDGSAADAPVLVGDNETPSLFNGGEGGSGDGGVFADAFVLPENFVPTQLGGYALGPPITGGGTDGGVVQNGNTSNCSLVVGVVRDFLSYGLQDGGDPDFEDFSGSAATLGLVQNAIGTDRKPVYGAECDDNSVNNPPCTYGQQMTTQANFDEWYRYTPSVNLPYLVYLEFVPNGNVYTFQSTSFFPLDDAGFGNTPGIPGVNHNFSFTTELHLEFTYKGGETFSFTGDDDLWVFINGALAIDLGGLHQPVSKSVSLDSLNLTKGVTYPIELFNAERHSTGSNFRVDTNLAFTNCGTVPPDVPK